MAKLFMSHVYHRSDRLGHLPLGLVYFATRGHRYNEHPSRKSYRTS